MKRILSVLFLLAWLFSVSVPSLAAQPDKTADVYAKYEETIKDVYQTALKDGSGAVTVAEGTTVSVSGAPASAKMLEVFAVPASESEALDWMGGKIKALGTLSHAYIIKLVDTAGKKTDASGVTVKITCPHCNGDEIAVGLNSDGTAALLDAAEGGFAANGNTYFIVAEQRKPSGVTVPVRGDDNEIHADATLDGKTVELHELDFAEIDHIVGDHVNTGTVEIDLTHLADEITVIELPMGSIKHIVEAAEEAHNDTEALQIDFPVGSVKLDDKTLRAIIDKVGEQTTVDLVLESVGTERLNDVQKRSLQNLNVHGGVEAHLLCNTTSIRISDFKGGLATMYVPFTLPKGVSADKISVWHIDDHGTLEKMKTAYADGVLSWEVGHFSDFIIASEKEEAAPVRKPVPVPVWISGGSLLGLAVDAVVILILEKKAKKKDE